MSTENLDDLPEGWAWAKLGELGTWAGGGTPTTTVSQYWDSGTIPWISAKDMKSEFLGASQDSITEAGRVAARLTLLPPGSILMVVRGMILARTFPVAVTTAHATINQDLRALIPFAGVESRYLLRALQLASRDVVQATGEATHGTRRLETDTLKEWPIALPPHAEQLRIIEAVRMLHEKIATARERLSKAAQIFGCELVGKPNAGLTQAVLDKAFRGELVPTEAELARREGRSYEPASEILSRLKTASKVEPKPKRTRAKGSSTQPNGSDESLLDFMEG